MRCNKLIYCIYFVPITRNKILKYREMNMQEEPIVVAQIMGKWVGGGVEAVIMNYYRHIDRAKIQFDFICDADSTCIPYDEIKELGGNVILCPPYQKVFKYQKFLINLFKEKKYKIVHSNINTLSVFPLRAAKKAGVPIRIAHNHATTSRKEWKRNILKKIFKRFIKFYSTDYMACSIKAGKWMFGNKNIIQNKVFILNNAIDVQLFKYNEVVRNKIRKEYEIKDNQIIIGHVGRMMQTKNQEFVIKVFYELVKENDCILMLAGDGPDKEKIINQVDGLNLSSKVIFLGQKNNIADYYEAFDVLILPSLYEGFGMVTIEAQCSNLPCVVSTGVPFETKINENYLFCDLSCGEKSWAKSILSLIKLNRRSDKTKRITEFGFDVNIESKKLENKYFQLLEEKKLCQE